MIYVTVFQIQLLNEFFFQKKYLYRKAQLVANMHSPAKMWAGVEKLNQPEELEITKGTPKTLKICREVHFGSEGVKKGFC